MATPPHASEDGAPAVSVIVPAYNVAPWIEETLRSILDQAGFDDFEVLVVDDRLQDDTAAIVQRLAGQDPRLRLLRNEGPQGAAGARNHGLAQARGEWLAFLDGDDLWLPDNLRLKMEAAKAHPDAELISSDFINENRADRPLSHSEWPVWRQSLLPHWASNVGLPPAPDEPALRLIADPLTCFLRDEVLGNTGTFVLKRARVLALGGFDTSLEIGEDVYLWLQVARHCAHLLFVHQPLMYYRYHPGSLTNQGYPAHAFFAEKFYRMLRASDDFSEYRSYIERRIVYALTTQNIYFRKCGRHADAIRWSINIIQIDTWRASSWRICIASVLGQ